MNDLQQALKAQTDEIVNVQAQAITLGLDIKQAKQDIQEVKRKLQGTKTSKTVWIAPIVFLALGIVLLAVAVI